MQVNRRILSLTSLGQRSRPAEDVHFSTLFTLDPESFQKLKTLVADFVERAHKTIHVGGTDEAYILNLDLFKT